MFNNRKLKAKLVERGMTQEQLATKLDIDSSTMSRKLNSEDGKYVSIKEARQMIELLNLTLDEATEIFLS